jgi:hypothetical protein
MMPTMTRANASAIDPLPISPPKPEDELPLALQAQLTAAVPADILSKLLEQHAEANKPKDMKLVAATANSVSIFYLQPVREYWYLPLKQTMTIRIAPPLPVLSKSASEAETDKWVQEVAERLQKFGEVKEIPMVSYLPPQHWGDWLGVAMFLGFTLLIAAHLLGVRAVADWVFTTDKRFNMAVAVHCGVLVKRSRDVRQLGDLLLKHWQGGRSGRLRWVLSGWIEGWRAVARFRREVLRANLEIAAMEGESGKKRESKKKR